MSRAWVLLPSGRRLDLLAPDPQGWTDRDLAIGLSRTFRWAGYSAWEHPLSVAQHSLTVLALRQLLSPLPLTIAEARRELLHDATEALLGRYDPITPLKPHLGEGYRLLAARHQQAVDRRYALPPWQEGEYEAHKQADRLAAASEALHVVGWSRDELRDDLEIDLTPIDHDPLLSFFGGRAWDPWPAPLAAKRFLLTLEFLLSRNTCDCLANVNKAA
jgi:5'-deoxynucleotidase YfbR-like HD superfamily hydrolase